MQRLYSAMTSPLLEVDQLSTNFFTRYGIVRAVHNVSFTIQRGETLGIVGESGCGKSVMARSLMRLVPEPPGTICAEKVLFAGENICDLSEQEMRHIRGNRIAMVFQEPMTALNPVLTIGRHMIEGLQIHLHMNRRQARTRAIELLRMVGISEPAARFNQYPHQLSGGMRQRVMVAIALSCNPELLIADEPTTALDVTIQAQILDLLTKAKHELNMAILLITHDLGVIAGMADRVCVMYAGSIVEQASVDMLYEDPRMPYTIGLLHSTPRLDQSKTARLTPIRGIPPSLLESEIKTGCPFSSRCDYVQEVCYHQKPVLQSVGEQHDVACLFDVTREQRNVDHR